MTDRRKHQKYKDDAIEHVISSGPPIAQVASDIGVKEGTLGTWERKCREQHPERFVTEEKAPVSWEKHEKALVAENAKLKQEIESSGKSQRLLCSEATVEDFYEFIETEKANHTVAWLCRTLKISQASFYWCAIPGARPSAPRGARGGGGPQVHGDRRQGRAGSAIQNPGEDRPYREPHARRERRVGLLIRSARNPAGRGYHVLGPVRGWLYLATVIDLCTGVVIGWNMDKHMRTELCTGALARVPRQRLAACR
ncbi:transposase [Pseudarthrobacter sulfonivorans]|uniref:transposase n=1 Tax=Pseudarthrobacter sulfonivorans TaxID=121292 RepID=UPI0012FE58A9|nr:transposase [Pseudarthrobacter sulfonivorans]